MTGPASSGTPAEALPLDAALLLRLAGEQAMASGHRFLDHHRLAAAGADHHLDPERFYNGVRFLAGARLVDAHTAAPWHVTLLQFTPAGLRRYLRDHRPGLEDLRHRLVATLQDHQGDWRDGAAVDLGAMLAEPSLAVEVILEDLTAEGMVVFSRASGRRVRIHRLSDFPIWRQ